MPQNWLRRLATKEKGLSQKEATARALSQALRGKCPRCQSDLDKHAFQRFAVTVASTEGSEEMLSFILKARNQDWESLAKFYDFDPTKNALEVYALRCADDKLNMLLVRDPFELFDCQSVEDWEALDENESIKWSVHLANKKWISFAIRAKGAA